MNVIVDFSLVPIGTNISLSEYLTACKRVLGDAGLKTTLHADGTIIEGAWDDVFAAIDRCHQAVNDLGTARISTTIKLATRIDGELTIEDKVKKVAERTETCKPEESNKRDTPKTNKVIRKTR